MAVQGTLYTCKGNIGSDKILIAAAYGKAKLNVLSEPPQFVFGETNRSSDFLAKFPLGKVPAFESSDGQYLTESNAIAFYVANEELRGKSAADKAQILQFIAFADNDIVPATCVMVYPCMGIIAQNKVAEQKSQEDLKKVFNYLNQHLLTRTFLVGERVSLADIAVFTAVLPLYKMILEPNCRKAYGNVNRWFETLLNQAPVQSVVGKVKLCEKTAQFDAKTFAEIHGKAGGDKKDVKKKDEKKKDAPPKKEASPPEEMDLVEEALAGQPKQKDPFEQFPKGTFVLDDFKRSYSNEDTAVSIPYFWEKFDADTWSLWYCEYKYPEDLTMVFMSCNLISGMMQRLDKMRKNAFASVCLFGDDNCSTISGIWLWKGHELAFPLSEDWQIDYESYQWKKLDPKEDSVKKMVNEYLAWEGQFGGKKFNQGKIFK